LNPDIALLQEVTGLRKNIAARCSAVMLPTSGPAGERYRFSTVVLAGPGSCSSEPLRSDTGWVDDELNRFPGNLISTRVRLGDADLRVISVHSPWWPLDRTRFAGLDTSAVKPAQSVELYLAHVLWAALPNRTSEPWVVGGDFNLSETFDESPNLPHGVGDWLDRMTTSAYTECLRASQGQVTPTYKNRAGGAVVHQIDHLFVSAPLAESQLECDIGSAERVFGDNLSDHLPIIATFA
jgi:endonuclease/exonuclease/phosphatase family metal-dependent hydrolase